MKDIFLDAAINLKNRQVVKWKKQDKKIVGYTCSFLPKEILYAADIIPYRIRGINAEGMDIADAYYGPFICTFPKCMLQLFGENKYSFLDGVIITDGCDSMRRLDECLRKAGEDNQAILPSFCHYFETPHKSDSHCIEWLIDGINIFISKLNKHFSVEITNEKIIESVCEYNKTSELMHDINELRQCDDIYISGYDVFIISIAATSMPINVFNKYLVEYITELKQKKEHINNKKRIMLLGSGNDDISFIKTIEDAGAIIVSDNLCFGIDQHTKININNNDPVSSIAKHYLTQSTCPRMFGGYNERLKQIYENIEKFKVQGVILQNIRFCDLHGSENGLYETDLEAKGIKSLKIEREYGSKEDRGRLKMRIDAFLERLSNI